MPQLSITTFLRKHHEKSSNCWVRYWFFILQNIQRTRFMTHEFTSKEDVFLGLKRFFNIEGINKKAKVSDE